MCKSKKRNKWFVEVTFKKGNQVRLGPYLEEWQAKRAKAREELFSTVYSARIYNQGFWPRVFNQENKEE